MYKPSTYLVVTYFPTYLPIYETYFPTELVTKVKPNLNSVEVHPQLTNNGHPVDGRCASGCWFTKAQKLLERLHLDKSTFLKFWLWPLVDD
jgi:hypothetical protein